MSNLNVLNSRKKGQTKLTRNSKLFKVIINAILDKKGENIVSLDLKKIPEAVADFFIICQASNNNQLRAIADNIEKQSHEIAEIESVDNGKPFGMALHDVKFSTEILRYYAGWTDKKHG